MPLSAEKVSQTLLFFHSVTDIHYVLVSVLACLLDHGADVNAANMVTNSPLHEAISNQCNACAKYLLESMAAVNLKNRYYSYLLSCALLVSYFSCLRVAMEIHLCIWHANWSLQA
jgi:ankyrin repeat protein